MNKLVFWVLLGSTVSSSLLGCTTSVTGRSYSKNSPNIFSGNTARRLISEARATRDGGNQIAAIPQFHELIARFPDSKEAIEAHYFLGITYHDIGGHHDAIEELNRYLEAAPSGEHAQESRALVERLSKEYRKRFPTSAELDAEIASLRDDVASRPDSGELRKVLAGRLWRRGRYEEAGRIYLDIASRDEAFKSDPVFSRRIELHPNGSHVLLTPAEIMRREIERQPISVTNMTSFRSGRDRRTQVPRHFVVTGQAINHSDSLLYGVQILVTIYGFGYRVYDTGVYRIGEMYPGEIRAFTVRFSNFRELNSIERYDYSVRFQR